jgi:hypothetical protein
VFHRCNKIPERVNFWLVVSGVSIYDWVDPLLLNCGKEPVMAGVCSGAEPLTSWPAIKRERKIKGLRTHYTFKDTLSMN